MDLPDEKAVIALADTQAIQDFRDRALNPEHPTLRNTVQNGDIYFQVREANNGFYDSLPQIVEDYFEKITEITGREYHLFNYYGAPDATDVIVAMGSVSGTARQAVAALMRQGKKVGYLQVHLYRPFSVDYFLKALPDTVQRVAVMDRCKEMGSMGEPLYEDVCTALAGRRSLEKVIGGRYGLSSKDTDPAQIAAVFENLAGENSINGFTVGINDDVTHLSLQVKPFDIGDTDTVQCKFWGLGGDGTVGANHNTVRIINDATEKFAQAYFEYDAKKSFGVTKSHLRFSKNPIEGSYYVKQADFVGCHNQTFITRYDVAGEVRPGGSLLLNASWDAQQLESQLPAAVKRTLAQNEVKLYLIDATAIAAKLNLGAHTNTVLQAAFFAIAKVIPWDKAREEMVAAIRKSYFTKGEEVINKNIAAVDAGAAEVHQVEVPKAWINAADDIEENAAMPGVVTKLLEPINRQKGDDLPVSAFKDYEDGHIDMGLTAFEKRGIAVKIPAWNSTKCIQCNQCSLVCPHAVIRPYLLTEDEAQNAPEGFESVPAKGAKAKDFKFSMQVSSWDCTGCGSCVNCCPVNALEMVPANLCEEDKTRWSYGLALSNKGDVFEPYSVKGSQFRQPLIEFSAACAGCGETPYAKLLTQLFGDRVYWANATGCSQAWGAPMPGIPYTVNHRGFGPAWTNSLFENNAELTMGMFLSVRQQRKNVQRKVEEYAKATGSEVAQHWLEAFDDFDASRRASDELIEELSGTENEQAQQILARKDQLAKKTFWMFGGDGWAYDIDFGGLDHVVASGEDINVFVVDTEVYSNTGGQSSKATPLGAVAQFASAGKRTRKKDLGAIFRTYGNVYVAQVAMGANPNQLVKALKEAEAHKGPSVVIAYAPCTAHGIKAGMAKVQNEMKRAVEAGYWTLYRYDPAKEKPFTLDCGVPTLDYLDFLAGENRYASLRLTFPDTAEELFGTASEDAEQRFLQYQGGV